MAERSKSNQLFEEAKEYLPGGVNSPVRAFRSVNGSPLFFEKGKGSKIWDADGNEYIDFCCSWGPLILGHADESVLKKVSSVMANGTSFGAPSRYETELAKLIVDNHRFIEKIRFVNSGTEAAMSAIRLARGYTGKNKVIKFEGCYHGHVDSLMVKAGSGLATLGTSTSAGIPESFVKETIVLPLNDKAAVDRAIEKYGADIACIAIEPIPANNGLLLQDKEFLQFLRKRCDETGILLFFDEVISGFRVAFEGASGHYGIKPDMIAFGKIIGGGFPVGAYGASAEVMNHIAPDGPVYQAGTLSGNPVAMAAGIAQLEQCLKPGFYESLATKTNQMVQRVQSHAENNRWPFHMFHIGSIFWISFSNKNKVQSTSEIDPNSAERFKVFFDELLEQGVYVGPSSYEVGFVSAAHTEEDMEKAADAMIAALSKAYESN
ncbi:MAG: glutamate-1-semialdehyde 2,1-aminomutase [Salibacteraceae bacterium]